CFDGAILILPNSTFQELRERPGLDNILFRAGFDFTRKQFPEELNGQVSLRKTADLGQELIREDRDVGFLETCGGKDVYYLPRNDSFRDDLTDCVIEFFIGLPLSRPAFRKDGADCLEERHIITNPQRFFVGAQQEQRLVKAPSRNGAAGSCRPIASGYAPAR